MTDLRRMFYNRYKTSSIFNNNNPSNNKLKNINPSKEIYSKNDTFIPKYKKMTSKERYWHEMRYKEFGHSNNENKNINNLENINNKINNNTPSKSLKRNHSIKEMRKKKNSENKNTKSIDIKCRNIYNGYESKKNKMKRSKSLFELRSTLSNLPLNENSSRQERNLAYNGSNIFFDKSKDIQIQKSYNKYRKNKNNLNINNNNILSKSLKRQKSMSDFEKELNERKSKFSHSKFTTDMDWKTTNTEDIHYDYENYGSVLTDSGIKKKSYRRVNILKREMNCDLKNKNKNIDQKKESVKYNLLTGKDKKNVISDKIYNNFEDNNVKRKNFSKKKYDYKNNQNINKFQPNIEYYEIDIPRNFDLTDINTIRNFFTSKGLHAFNIEESSNSVTNQSGKISLRIRKDNIIDEKEYNKNINSVKQLISKKDMKLYKVEGNKAKASTIAKQRVKTPYKGEFLLQPSNKKQINNNNNNNIKNGLNSKKNSVKNSIKKNNKITSKKGKVELKTKK